MLLNIFLVALGGAIGSISRLLISEIFIKFSKNSQNFHHLIGKFPIATFAINVVGSMLAGVTYYFIIKNLSESVNTSNVIKNFVLIGALGGFTTFSTFSLDFFRLYNSGNFIIAFNYIFLSLIFSLCAIFAGFHLSKIIFS